MENKNVTLIQSYILTASRYNYSVQEQRILFLIIEQLQHHVAGKELKKAYSLSESLFGDYDFTFPITAFMKEKEQNHTLVITSLKNLNKKTIEIEDSKKWLSFNLIERPEFNKVNSTVSFRIHPLLATAFLDFSKGFSKYSLEVTRQFKSIYAMRFYMLFSTQRTTINYSIETLKLMFGIENKYANKTNDFERFVIKSAKTELDKICPISFHYAKYPEKGKTKGYTFYPYKTGIKDPVMENDLKNKVSIHWDLDTIFVNYIKENFAFIDSEIKHNIDLFKKCQTDLEDFAMVLTEIKANMYKANPANKQGYLIKSLRQQLEQLNPSPKKAKTTTKKATKTTINSIIGLAESKRVK